MKVTKIGFGRLEAVKKFSNIKAYAEADLAEGEDPEKAYEELSQILNRVIEREKDNENLNMEINRW